VPFPPTHDWCNPEGTGNRLRSRVIRPLAELEREAILEALEFCGPEEAAKLLGIGTSTLYRKLVLYHASVCGAQPPESRTAIAIPLEKMRVLLHEADRAAKALLFSKEETLLLIAQALSKQVESFCQAIPQLKTWKK